MLELKLSQLDKKNEWQAAGVKLPEFDVQAMIKETSERPVWLHFGAGNIFRGFIAVLQQRLLEQGLEKSGIIASDTFDYGLIDMIYKPFDNLALLVGLKPEGTTQNELIASIADSIRGDSADAAETARMKAVFAAPSLQMVSFTITEKGYALKGIDGEFFPMAAADMEAGPEKARLAMSFVTAMLWERFKAGAYPIAMVSMDNCSHNGEKLKGAVLTVARAWAERGFVSAEFVAYLEDETKVSFPWSMIDKITPRPAKEVEAMLQLAGIADMKPIVTEKNTFIAPFVNAEIPQYLVIEDKFPNGRPALEKAGVYMTDRETVNNTERMKVTTCLNPLHTALAVYGCLLGYDRIAKEMLDSELKGLVEKMGYEEGMPVVVDPKILSPMDFIHEVIDVRLPNPFVPDMPQRIATDTSQKVGIRFGETMKSYVASDTLDVTKLTYIPLVLAGWCRYLLAVDDEGNAFECSSDPMLDTLQGYLQGIKLGDVSSVGEKLRPILSNDILFGVNLYEVGLGEKIEGMFKELIQGPGAVRATLVKYITDIRQESLRKHYEWNGKIEVVARCEVNDRHDLSLAYTPGVAEACLVINKDVDKSYELTRRNNLVAVITDGTAILGLGDIGPEAGMPVMEGKCALFKTFADVDAFPICIRSKDVDELVRTIYLISGSFGGINLEDISAPRCFEVERKLKEICDIPVFHDDQHGTAIVVAAALLNALRVVKKNIGEVKVVINGAGSAGIAIGKHLLNMGVKHLTMVDRFGMICKGMEGLNPAHAEIAELTNLEHQMGNLADAMKGADVFIGVSAPNIVSEEMIQSMAKDAIVFPMANPTPEIMPDKAKAAGARVVGTGRSDFPNQINNVLAFPGIFRGALDCRATCINEEMKVATSYALASLISDEELSEENIIAPALDKRVAKVVAEAVIKAAKETGVARI